LPTWSPAMSRTGRPRIREMKTEFALAATPRLSQPDGDTVDGKLVRVCGF
jgi:hypothetical protein